MWQLPIILWTEQSKLFLKLPRAIPPPIAYQSINSFPLQGRAPQKKRYVENNNSKLTNDILASYMVNHEIKIIINVNDIVYLQGFVITAAFFWWLSVLHSYKVTNLIMINTPFNYRSSTAVGPSQQIKINFTKYIGIHIAIKNIHIHMHTCTHVHSHTPAHTHNIWWGLVAARLESIMPA